MKLFWYEKLAAVLFVIGTLLMNAVASTLAGGNAIPDEWMLAVQVLILMSGFVIALMGLIAAEPKGFSSVKYGLAGFVSLGLIFVLFGSAGFWQVLTGQKVLPNVFSPMVILMLLALASFSAYKTRERRKLTFD